MFKNSVFKASVNTKKWFKATGVRVVKTMAQSFLAYVGTGVVGIAEVDWKQLAGIVVMAGIISFVTCLAGIKEVPAEEGTEKIEENK